MSIIRMVTMITQPFIITTDTVLTTLHTGHFFIRTFFSIIVIAVTGTMAFSVGIKTTAISMAVVTVAAGIKLPAV